MDGMVDNATTQPVDLAERSQTAGGDKSAGGPPPQRFSAKRKLRVVSRLLRGEPLELVARELNVTAARLSAWRDQALLAAEAALKERERDDREQGSRLSHIPDAVHHRRCHGDRRRNHELGPVVRAQHPE
jgi:Transposase